MDWKISNQRREQEKTITYLIDFLTNFQVEDFECYKYGKSLNRIQVWADLDFDDFAMLLVGVEKDVEDKES